MELLQIILLLLLHLLPIHPVFANDDGAQGYRIAIIGGGISGSFATKYISEYDVAHLHEAVNGKRRERCLVSEIVVYDVSPPPPSFSDDDKSIRSNDNSNNGDVLQSSTDPRPENWQGSRVSSITVKDTVIELGASIIYDGNQLVVDMMNADPDNLVRTDPMGTSTLDDEKDNAPYGFGIYHGNKEWLLKTNGFGSYPSFLRKMLVPIIFLWRYNLDYFRLQNAVSKAVHAFDIIYGLLNDTKNELTYFESPMELWEAIGLLSASAISFHDLLDGLGLYRDASLEMHHQPQETKESNSNGWWNWRKWLPGMGCMRSELVTAMTINTYNADLNDMNGLVGLVAYVPTSGELFSVKGGNNKLMQSALYQSRILYESASACKESKERIQRKQAKVTAVISNGETMELLSNEDSLGEFDIVILAAPLQQCRIQFLTHNPMGMDSSILHPMPLGGVHDNIDNEDMVDESGQTNAINNEHGDLLFAAPLPPSATSPYTPVVTTIISNATINASHFGLDDNEPLPRSILVSERGKMLEGITTLRIISKEKGLIKIFSTEELSLEKRNMMFGSYHIIEYVQVWGGGENREYGGATPNFAGGRNSESLPFLLYDGSKHWSKNDGPALYYANAIESSVAAIEISAIGAKSVAKLVARRLGLIAPIMVDTSHDEL